MLCSHVVLWTAWVFTCSSDEYRALNNFRSLTYACCPHPGGILIFGVWLAWIRTVRLLPQMPVFSVFYLQLLPSDLFGGKLCNLWWDTSLYLRCWVTYSFRLNRYAWSVSAQPVALPCASFSYNCWLQRGWSSSSWIVTIYHPEYYSKFTLAPVFFHILACKVQQFKSWGYCSQP